jgi:UDP-N-acetyl-D-mannosaminuronic acid dehydrogenase
VGGHCIAVDPWFIVARAPEESHLIRAAREVNSRKPDWVLEQVVSAVDAYLRANSGATAGEVTIACYGLTFKPNIDDLRESPAVAIAEALNTRHAGPILAVEPNISTLPAGLRGVRLVDEATARAEADIHVMLVDHREFQDSPPPGGHIIDTRGVWSA